MKTGDWRKESALYYDLNPRFPDDVPFYLSRLPSSDARTLELGCGTGRLSVPLALCSASFLGVDSSQAMLQICHAKIREAGLPESRASVQVADISQLAVSSQYDFIVAPFRVMQNLETDEQVAGLFRGIRTNLRSGGRCILNVFKPNRDLDEFIEGWVRPGETLAWEVSTDEGRVACYERRVRVEPDPLVVYPELVYRRYVGQDVVDEAILSIAMRCYYPHEFVGMIEGAGFKITATWGGYAGESYGEGTELVAEFTSQPN